MLRRHCTQAAAGLAQRGAECAPAAALAVRVPDAALYVLPRSVLSAVDLSGDPAGVEVTSFGRLPRRSGSIVTVAAPKSPDAAAGILAQLQSAVSAMYEVPLP